jgi:hypothetical protein
MKINQENHKLLAFWATDCAEHVLTHFEKEYPNDKRPRKAIEVGRAWARGEIKTGAARNAALDAHAAARDANHPTACFAARASGHAAATTHVPKHVIAAMNYAVKACGKNEREWQSKNLPENLRLIIKKI